MASTSGQGFIPERNYRCWLDETFSSHETADDELSYTPDVDNNLIETSSQDFSLTLEPVIGMEFESAEDARDFYEMYGFRAEKYATSQNRVLPSRPATGKGCNAMLRITAKDGGTWVIYGFVKEHNHELNPNKIPPRRSHRIAFCEDEKDLKIRELSTELHREKKKSAAYQEKLQIVLKYIEEHTQRLSLKVELATNNMRELESEEQDSSYSD
ncbi:hypothetical protein L3X38_004312 [Prunus dulcis]|uniref:FAR1 domain-containing protein n=1 Tax=Prunus dulcis TaxID=3755 RepID=A0AAD5F305_PRUDU|nr:hypothetical protein L3X38_004312 [Prunus dulcis]